MNAGDFITCSFCQKPFHLRFIYNGLLPRHFNEDAAQPCSGSHTDPRAIIAPPAPATAQAEKPFITPHVQEIMNALTQKRHDLFRDTLLIYNEIARSAGSIANRGGQETNWPAFAMKVERVLKENHHVFLEALYHQRESVSKCDEAERILTKSEDTPQETEPQTHLIQIRVCQPCLDGIGSECHTAGCALWLHKVDLPIHRELYEIIESYPASTVPAQAEPSGDEMLDWLESLGDYESFHSPRGGFMLLSEKGDAEGPTLRDAIKAAMGRGK